MIQSFCFVGELNACSMGTSFLPHIITVNAGEVCLISEKKKLGFHLLNGVLFVIHRCLNVCQHLWNVRESCDLSKLKKVVLFYGGLLTFS